jgi:hypothetical protein
MLCVELRPVERQDSVYDQLLIGLSNGTFRFMDWSLQERVDAVRLRADKLQLDLGLDDERTGKFIRDTLDEIMGDELREKYLP